MRIQLNVRCLGCGYILDGLPESRCPECGRRFDPNDATTFVPASKQNSGWSYLALAVVSWAMAEVVRAWLESGLFAANIPAIVLALALMAAMVGIGVTVTVKSMIAWRGRRDPLQQPAPFDLTVIVSCLNVLRTLHFVFAY